VELARYKKRIYGPRADRLSASELAQMLLKFAGELEQKPIHTEDIPKTEAEPEPRRVKRRKGRRALANFENLPVSTQVYELSAEESVRAAVSNAKRLAAMRAGRSNTFPGTSNGFTCVRSMRAPVVSVREKIHALR
jgi:Transposase C of IS166 homeodomain